MRRILSGILLSLSMLNAANTNVWAGPIVHPRIVSETATTAADKPPAPDPKKLNEAAATVLAVKHCLAMDGSLNQQPRLVDAYNTQPDLENLPKDISIAEKEIATLYTMGRPDIPDFGFLIPDIWRVTPRDARIKFNAIISLKLSEAMHFKYGSYNFSGNCKPVMLGDIIKSDIYENARINMPLAFGDKDVKLTYLMVKQNGYNWQIEDLLIDDVGITNYIRKDLAPAVNSKGVIAATKEICTSEKTKNLKCN